MSDQEKRAVVRALLSIHDVQGAIKAIIGRITTDDWHVLMELHAQLCMNKRTASAKITQRLWEYATALRWINEIEQSYPMDMNEQKFQTWLDSELRAELHGLTYELNDDSRGYAVYIRTDSGRSNSWRGENWWGIGRG